ncbi:MAG: hypothetical protein ACU83U_08215 [Gammaproteobacteria bacterium]
MSEKVRLAVTDGDDPIVWPKYCPKCGTRDSLLNVNARVGQVKSMRPNLHGGWTMKSNVLYFSFPMCGQHAKSTRVANLLLEKSPLMYLLRAFAYMGFVPILPLFIALVSGQRTLEQLLNPTNPPPTFFMVLMLYGIVMVAAVIWARLSTAVWPRDFDPDMNVINIHFSDVSYAQDFKRANPVATDEWLTASPPWYKRSLLWKVVIIIGFLVWMSHLMQ